MCIKTEGKAKLLVPKLDNLFKHGGQRKVVATILSVCKTREFLCEQRVYLCKKKKSLYAITSQCNVLNQL
jgi:hypothetical protein